MDMQELTKRKIHDASEMLPKTPDSASWAVSCGPWPMVVTFMSSCRARQQEGDFGKVWGCSISRARAKVTICWLGVEKKAGDGGGRQSMTQPWSVGSGRGEDWRVGGRQCASSASNATAPGSLEALPIRRVEPPVRWLCILARGRLYEASGHAARAHNSEQPHGRVCAVEEL